MIDDAIDAFSLSILRDCRSVKRMPLNTWIDVKILPPVDDPAKPHVQLMTSVQIERDTAKFMLMARKAVLSSQVRLCESSTMSGSSGGRHVSDDHVAE